LALRATLWFRAARAYGCVTTDSMQAAAHRGMQYRKSNGIEGWYWISVGVVDQESDS
jgi:hypothetical protein